MAIKEVAELARLVSILEGRNALLYHACQLQDFRSYIKLGGVPSRNKLLDSGEKFTVFDTDEIDKENKVWDKVFGNFSDFGTRFVKADSGSLPNPYGPIQIVFRPSVLKLVSDISITLRSAGASDFDRDAECISKAEDLNSIYLYPDNSVPGKSRLVVFKDELNQRFGRSNSRSPEFNCAVDGEILSFDHCAYILVDGCKYNGGSLVDEVRKTTTKTLYERTYPDSQKKLIIEELSMLSLTYDCTKPNFARSVPASEALKAWVSARDDFHYNRFITYLSLGTTRV